MQKLYWIIPTVLTIFTACNTASPTNPNPINTRALGLLEVTLDFSDEAHPTGTANFKPFQNGAQSRNISVNGNETSRIALKRNNVGFIDAFESYGVRTRYVRGTFDIANFSPRAFNNLNFMAVSLNTQLGTMFSSLKNGSDVTIPATDTLPNGELTYRALKPTHGMRLEGTKQVIDPQAADMQVFTPSEAGDVQSLLASVYPGLQVLEYGYTARSIPGSSTSRTIAITPTTVNCSSTLSTPPNTYTFVVNNSSCFTGQVTFAFKFPRKPVRSQNPFAFSFSFVVSDETGHRTTQSLEEQNLGMQTSLEQILTLDAPSGINPLPSEQRRIRTLPGSGVFNYSYQSVYGVQQEMVCSPQTAVATTTPVLPADYLSTKPGLIDFLPNPNNNFASGGSIVSATFCNSMNAPTRSSLVVHGSLTGNYAGVNATFAGTYSGAGSSLTYAPQLGFKFGEEIEVSLTNGITRIADGVPLNPIVYRFRTATVPQIGGLGSVALATYPSGGLGYDLATGDFNGDLSLDLVITNYNVGTVSVLLGRSFGTPGTFGPKTSYPAGINPSFVKAADLNNDGRLDLVVTNPESNLVSVLLNTGTGTFGAKVSYATGSGPTGLTVGDFNADGKLDLAVTNTAANTISVLLGTGSGTFNPKTDYVTGKHPFGITSGDFNNDGTLDLGVANYVSNTVSVLLGTGLGTFNSKTDYATGKAPQRVTSGDFDGNHTLDLGVANEGSSTVSVLSGTGFGTFNPKVDIPTAIAPVRVISGDFDGDGFLDLVTANLSGSMSILFNAGFTSSTTFKPKIDIATSTPFPSGIEAGDFNNDGKLDLGISSQYSFIETIDVFLNN